MTNFIEISMTEFNDTHNMTLSSETVNNELFYERHQFIITEPWLAIPCIIILLIASVAGTFGNMLTLVVIATKSRQRNAESIFIANLAISDLYVTILAQPMSIVAKVEGEEFFESVPKLCQAIASMCTISCVTSLMTIGLMSLNRYIYICVNKHYEHIFTKKKCILMCMSVYFVGILLVSLNGAEIGDHGYDRKSIECIWDRMATYPYTIVFSIALVWIPSFIIGCCYFKIFLYVTSHNKRMREQQILGERKNNLKSFRLAKTLFIIYAVFFTCWAPYALLIVLDSNDDFPYESHLIITLFAHLHPSINWIIYYFTNKRFATSYMEVLLRVKLCILCKGKYVTDGQYRSKEIITDGSSDRIKNVIKSQNNTDTKDSGFATSSVNTVIT
ncbi:melatonin receptor type 1B-B-like [Ruditapes philippinarum]|uniref:melatonin receptor type 1B-B-like n=1 Tax=Ruditapes philippinarum TaxID=129788 RepID=UPI00295C314E|nr:melatonin receptor type 1B-B-like [Ruditapes philippinarum]